MIKRILIALVLVGCISCDNLFFDDRPKTNPLEVYDAFVEELDTNSPFLLYLSVDVDSLFEAHRRLINKKETGEQLIDSMDEILNVIKDAHTGLVYDEANDRMIIYYSKWMNLHPENRLSDISHYFESYSIIGGERIEFGKLAGSNIGYIRINSMLMGKLVNDIEEIIESYKDTNGIIFDLRSTYTELPNSLGYREARDIMKLFSDTSTVYLYKRYRFASVETGFTRWDEEWIPMTIYPAYSIPIIILTNRKTKDAAELLTAGLKKLPSVTVIGDTTAGFIGTPNFTHLAGDWYMNVSNEEFKLPDNYMDASKRFSGIPPDSNVHISPEDSVSGIDTILETAIDILSN